MERRGPDHPPGLVLVELTNRQAREVRGRRATDITRIDPVLLGGGKVYLDLESRFLHHGLNLRVHDARHLGDLLAQLLSFLCKHVRVDTVDTDDKGIGRA